MKIVWEIYDGYVGKSRPHYCEIPDDELEGLEGDEKDQFITDWVQQDFDQTVSFTWQER